MISEEFKIKGFIPDLTKEYNCCIHHNNGITTGISYLQSIILGNRIDEFNIDIKDDPNTKGWTAFTLAIMTDNNIFIDLLIEHTDINYIDKNNSTYLMHAAECNNLYAFTKILYDKKFNRIEHINDFGTNIISYARINDKMIEMIINYLNDNQLLKLLKNITNDEHTFVELLNNENKKNLQTLINRFGDKLDSILLQENKRGYNILSMLIDFNLLNTYTKTSLEMFKKELIVKLVNDTVYLLNPLYYSQNDVDDVMGFLMRYVSLDLINKNGENIFEICKDFDDLLLILFDRDPIITCTHLEKQHGNQLICKMAKLYVERFNTHAIVKNCYLETKSGPLGNILKFL